MNSRIRRRRYFKADFSGEKRGVAAATRQVPRQVTVDYKAAVARPGPLY